MKRGGVSVFLQEACVACGDGGQAVGLGVRVLGIEVPMGIGFQGLGFYGFRILGSGLFSFARRVACLDFLRRPVVTEDRR